MAQQVNKALFVGLGGTGYKVLLQVKKALIRNYGEVPPSIKILCFDTDIAKLRSHSEELSYKNKEGNYVTEQIKFDASEMVIIPITSAHKLLKFDHIQRWVSKKIEKRVTPSSDGAKQIRSLGRFAFFENYNSVGIKSILETKLGEINDGELHRNSKYSITQTPPKVHMVFSPSGGTGAGSFLDVTMTIRELSPSIDIKAWIVMPEFYKKFPMTTSVIRNGYASLMEIDHLMGKDNTEDKPWSGYNTNEPFSVNYTGSDHDTFDLGASEFFNFVYLFDNVNALGNQINDVEDMYDRIGRVLYLMVSGTGDDLMSQYSNNEDYDHASSPETGSKRRNYSSIGMAQIILDKEYLKDIKTNKMYKTILNSFMQTSEFIDETEFDNIIDSNNWREDRNQDQIIDALFPKTDLNYDIESETAPDKYEKGCSDDLSSNANLFQSSWEKKINAQCKMISDKIYSDFEVKLPSLISNYIDSVGGMIKTKQFVSYMKGAFQGMREEMDVESTAHKLNYENFEKNSDTYIETIIEVENGFNPYKKSTKIKEAADSYIENINSIMLEKWNYIRKDNAKHFYDKSILLINKISSNVQRVDALIFDATTEIERENQKLVSEEMNEKDFEIYIHKFNDNITTISDNDLSLPEVFSAIDFKNILNCKSVKDIKNLMSSYVQISKAIKDVENLTVEKVLKELEPENRDNILTYLDKASSVSINIDETSFLANSSKPNMEEFAIMLTENEDSSYLGNGAAIYNKFDNMKNIAVSSTGNPNVLTMVKVKGMFPANAIKRIGNWKEDFLSSISKGGYHFSDVYFEKNAIDLIEPKKDKTDSLQWFSIASALDIIGLERGGLSLKYKNRRIEALYLGNRGKTDRSKAFDIFSENKDYIKFIDDAFEKELSSKGKDAMSKILLEFYNNLDTPAILGKRLSSIDKESDEFHQIQEERESIYNFAMARELDYKLFE